MNKKENINSTWYMIRLHRHIKKNLSYFELSEGNEIKKVTISILHNLAPPTETFRKVGRSINSISPQSAERRKSKRKNLVEK